MIWMVPSSSTNASKYNSDLDGWASNNDAPESLSELAFSMDIEEPVLRTRDICEKAAAHHKPTARYHELGSPTCPASFHESASAWVPAQEGIDVLEE
eukprot:1972245-Rhodomonas_salina.1